MGDRVMGWWGGLSVPINTNSDLSGAFDNAVGHLDIMNDSLTELRCKWLNYWITELLNYIDLVVELNPEVEVWITVYHIITEVLWKTQQLDNE